MTNYQGCIAEIKNCYCNLQGQKGTLDLIKKFIFQLEIDIKKPCYEGEVTEEFDELETEEFDELEIVNFLGKFKEFLEQNKFIDQISTKKFIIEAPPPVCPRGCPPPKKCHAEQAINEFIESLQS